MVSLPLLPKFRPVRVLYVYGVIIVALFLMAFLWFILWAGIVNVRGAILSTMSQYDVVDTPYPSFELADTFLNNLCTYFLVIIVIVLLYWAIIYSQRKGSPYYGG